MILRLIYNHCLKEKAHPKYANTWGLKPSILKGRNLKVHPRLQEAVSERQGFGGKQVEGKGEALFVNSMVKSKKARKCRNLQEKEIFNF